MGRYQNSKIQKTNVIRGEQNPNPYNNVISYRTTIYNSIPESDSDIWLITQPGDRLDSLAHRFYSNSALWWYIAKANNLSFISVPTGLSIRIPGSKQYALGT